MNAGQNADYRSKFADAKSGRVKFNRSKNGECIIPVSDIYDTTFEGIDNVLVFAKGTISNPIITSVIEIYEYDETSLDRLRRRIYDSERRGIQQKAGELFGRYFSSDFEFRPNQQRTGSESIGNSGNNGHGRRSGTETEAVKDQSKISYSLKKPFRPKEDWHTGLTKAQIKIVNESIRRAGSPEANRITDTACWYKGRLDGEDLFAIYSTEDAEPTVLYLARGENAKVEQDILTDLLEEENGKSAYGKSSFTQGVSEGNWLQNVNGSQHNIQRVGTRANNQNVRVLQGQSERRGSGAFENVIKDLFDIQELATVAIEEGLNGQESFSLKDKATFSTDGMTESDIENARSVIKNLKTNAISSKYIDGFASYTPERMEREIANSSSREVVDYAKSYITWVEPIDFIYATTTSEQYRNQLKEEAGSLDIVCLHCKKKA